MYIDTSTYLGLEFLHELRLALLALLVSLQLALVARVLLLQPPSQLDVLLEEALSIGVLARRLALLQLQRLLQLKYTYTQTRDVS